MVWFIGLHDRLVRYGGPTKDLFPSVEGISEFRVNTASNSAEYAQPTDLTVVTKSGSNQVHGSAFWYPRDACATRAAEERMAVPFLEGAFCSRRVLCLTNRTT